MPVGEAAAHRFHILDVLIDEAVERDQLADNRQAEFEHGAPKLTQIHGCEHISHLQSCDKDFDCESYRERNHGVEHLLLLHIERVGLVQGDRVELADQVYHTKCETQGCGGQLDQLNEAICWLLYDVQDWEGEENQQDES